jgi:hypothetical protein
MVTRPGNATRHPGAVAQEALRARRSKEVVEVEKQEKLAQRQAKEKKKQAEEAQKVAGEKHLAQLEAEAVTVAVMEQDQYPRRVQSKRSWYMSGPSDALYQRREAYLLARPTARQTRARSEKQQKKRKRQWPRPYPQRQVMALGRRKHPERFRQSDQHLNPSSRIPKWISLAKPPKHRMKPRLKRLHLVQKNGPRVVLRPSAELVRNF